MGRGMDRGREEVGAVALQPLGRESGGGDSKVEDLGYGCADRPLVSYSVAKHHVVGRYAGLSVGRSGEIVEP